MAKTNENPIPGVNPLFTLKEDALKHLQGMEADIEEAERLMKVFEEIGIDQSIVREKVAWAKKTRQLLLDNIT